MKIVEYAKKYYDFVLLDVHSGLNKATSYKILEGSDIIIFCLNQNGFYWKILKRHLPEIQF